MMYHTCLNSKYKYLFPIFENIPTVCFYKAVRRSPQVYTYHITVVCVKNTGQHCHIFESGSCYKFNWNNLLSLHIFLKSHAA